jgi:hypothetical protein
MEFDDVRGFLKHSCAILQFWKNGRNSALAARFSHGSHRGSEKACANLMAVCVKQVRKRMDQELS